MTNSSSSHPRQLLSNVAIPPGLCLLEAGLDNWCRADVLIENQKIAAVTTVGVQSASNVSVTDAKGSILVSALVDCHTHVDKAHVAAFHEFRAGDLHSAIEAMASNKETWTAESLTQRVEFSLQSAYAYGVRAMRSHVDFSMQMAPFIWDVMTQAQRRWRGRVDLQLCPLAGIAFFQDADFRDAIIAKANEQGRLGLFLYDQHQMEDLLDPVFDLAAAHDLELDFHVDEGLGSQLNGLSSIAKMVQKKNFQNTVLCGHCVALSMYPPAQRAAVIAQATDANLHFVSLPLSNLYLQSREPSNPPIYRGMAPVAQLLEQGHTVSFGADNVRDGFCAFGDFDPLAVLGVGAQVGHLSEAVRDWISLITTNPSKTMGLEWDGIIRAGAPADLVLLAARNSGEFNLRNTVERRVMRQGCWIDATLPSFSDLNKEGLINAI